MKITAYKSEYTGEIFEHEKDYDSHIKKVKTYENEQKKRLLKIEKENEFIASVTKNISSIKELAEYILNNQEELLINLNLDHKKNKFLDGLLFQKNYLKNNEESDFKEGKIKLEHSFEWDNDVSLYHNAPKDMQTNWGGHNKELPTGAPGWRGVMWYKTNKNNFNYETIKDIFKKLGVNFCSGGSGGGDWSRFGFEIFAKDFPNLAYESMLTDMKENISKFSYQKYEAICELVDIKKHIKEESFKEFLEIVGRKYPNQHKRIMAHVLSVELNNSLELKLDKPKVKI